MKLPLLICAWSVLFLVEQSRCELVQDQRKHGHLQKEIDYGFCKEEGGCGMDNSNKINNGDDNESNIDIGRSKCGNKPSKSCHASDKRPCEEKQKRSCRVDSLSDIGQSKCVKPSRKCNASDEHSTKPGCAKRYCQHGGCNLSKDEKEIGGNTVPPVITDVPKVDEQLW